ncbi:MAG: hypothetical protein ACRDKS_03560, partial [Actinomycetota bacterium]
MAPGPIGPDSYANARLLSAARRDFLRVEKRNHDAIRYFETAALSWRAVMSIRVVLAEDNYLVREGVKRLLES